MLNVCNNQLVVDRKGIYSVEKFLVARRLMYWQVYLHKTVIVAEYMLILILERAKLLVKKGETLFAPEPLNWMLQHQFGLDDLSIADKKSILIENFTALDDSDILSSIKAWCKHTDRVLSYLSNAIVNRKLLKILVSDRPVSKAKLSEIKMKARDQLGLKPNEMKYFVFTGSITNNIYEADSGTIKIFSKNNETIDLENASDIDFKRLSKTVRKHFICYPKELELN
jgi:uncharacterized protein